MATKHPRHDLYDRFSQFSRIVKFLPIDIRKDIMTMLRVGMPIHKNVRLQKALGKKWQRKNTITFPVYTVQWGRTEVSIPFILDLIEPLLLTPVRRGYLSTILRAAGDRTGSWRQVLEEAKAKELSVTQQFQKRSYEIQFPFFESRAACLTIQMHPTIPYRPHVALLLRHRFLTYKTSLSGVLLVPQCTSSKTIGSHSSESLLRASAIFGHDSHNVTTVDLEAYYMETGGEVEGPCEVRWAWKYNDLKPRLYYAIGASAYYASRYTWTITDRLVKLFRATDPHQRFSFTRFPLIDLQNSHHFMIYDYASFTSNLAEFHNFTNELAVFLEGTRCFRFDTHNGIVEDDIGQILHHYNSICNDQPKFSVHRVIEGVDQECPVAIVSQEVAGLLGVYGNIVGSTAFHGLVGIMIAGDEDLINAIGDDAGIVFDVEEMSIDGAKDAIRSLGEIADGKFEFWTEDSFFSDEPLEQGWHFVKRPIDVSATMIKQGWMPDFPNIGSILGFKDDVHTVPTPDFLTRRRLLIKQSTRLIETMRRNIELVQEDDIDLAITILGILYRQVNLPCEGSLPVERRHSNLRKDRVVGDDIFCIPRLCRDSFIGDWFQVLRGDALRDGVIRIPKQLVSKEELPFRLIPGTQFESRGSKVLSLLVKMKVLVQYNLFDEYTVDEYSLDLLENYMGPNRRPRLYEYICISEYTPWEAYRNHVAFTTLDYPFTFIA